MNVYLNKYCIFLLHGNKMKIKYHKLQQL